jgi:signal transduction histidine kinase
MPAVIHSLRFRLFLVTIVVSVLSIGALVLFSSRITILKFQEYVAADAADSLQAAGTELAAHFAQNQSWDGLDPVLERMGKIASKQFILVDSERKLVGTSGGALSQAEIEVSSNNDVSVKWKSPPLDGTKTTRTVEKRPTELKLRDVPHVVVRSPKDELIGTLYVLPPTSPTALRDQAIFAGSINRSLALAGLAAVIGALLGTVLLSRRILRPVETLTTAVRRMKSGDLNQRVEVRSRDEIGELAQAFNSMSNDLSRVEQLRRNMVNDIAHELRTPLTNIQGQLEAIQDGLAPASPGMLKSLYEEAMLLKQIVDDLQELALAESNQLGLDRTAMSLIDQVTLAANSVRSQASRCHIDLNVEVPSGLPPVYADPKRVGQILRNLLNNAIAHSSAGGVINLRATLRDHEIELTVQDGGTGIAQEHLDNVFERFYRVDTARQRSTGTAGLGLAIVKQFVELHGGRVWVESAEGRGATFSFTLPIWKRHSLSHDSKHGRTCAII